MGFKIYRINLQLGTERISALAVAIQGIKALMKLD